MVVPLAALAALAGAGGVLVMLAVLLQRGFAATLVARYVNAPKLTPWTPEGRATARRAWGGLIAAAAPHVRPLVGGSAERMAQRLRWAGWSMTPEEFTAAQVIAAAAGVVLGLLAGVLVGHGAGVILPAVGALAGWMVPGELLDRRYRAARGTLGKEALGFGDFLIAAVQAGMQLEQALLRLGREMPGRLGRMMAQATQEGMDTREGTDMTLAAEIDDPTVSALVGAITQARATGGDLAGPLSGLLAARRNDRQQRVREQARGRAATGVLPLMAVFLPGVLLPIAFVVWKSLAGAGF